MKPVVFDGCFGWLHDADGDTGAVLCNSYGHEESWAHRSWRGLAEHLADKGVPALRFDYRGTGDSSQSEDDGNRVEAWVSSIVDAVHYLRKTTGVRRVVLCGVRLGGMLASIAAQRLDDIDGLVLMAPVEAGRGYLRELKLIHRRWRNTSAPHIAVEASSDGTIEALGFRLNAETVERLESLSLLRGDTVGGVTNVLILDPVKVAASDGIRDRFALAGSMVEVEDFPDYAHLMSESMMTPAPLALYEKLSAWITDLTGSSGNAEFFGEKAVDISIDIASGKIFGDGFIETPIVFGNGRLFGVYCQPTLLLSPFLEDNGQRLFQVEKDNALHQQAVLFSNTARSHHIGEARMWVTHARRLAKLGVASLRMDVGTIGDSADAPENVSVADLYLPQSVADAGTGIDWLIAAGHSRPTAVGICSGAYLTLHAAASHKAIVGVTLINQRDYFWAEGKEQAPGLAVATTNVYIQSMRSLDKWKRVMAGEIPVVAIVGTLIKRRLERLKARLTFIGGALVGKDSATGVVRKMFRDLSKRGVHVQVIYGNFDVGLEQSTSFLGKDFRWIGNLPNVKARIDASMDHALFLYPARDAMMHSVEHQLLDLLAVNQDETPSPKLGVASEALQTPFSDALSTISQHVVGRKAGEIA